MQNSRILLKINLTNIHMKKMMIALCTMTITYAANAQYDPAFRFGIKAAANLSNINVATI